MASPLGGNGQGGGRSETNGGTGRRHRWRTAVRPRRAAFRRDPSLLARRAPGRALPQKTPCAVGRPRLPPLAVPRAFCVRGPSRLRAVGDALPLHGRVPEAVVRRPSDRPPIRPSRHGETSCPPSTPPSREAPARRRACSCARPGMCRRTPGSRWHRRTRLSCIRPCLGLSRQCRRPLRRFFRRGSGIPRLDWPCPRPPSGGELRCRILGEGVQVLGSSFIFSPNHPRLHRADAPVQVSVDGTVAQQVAGDFIAAVANGCSFTSA